MKSCNVGIFQDLLSQFDDSTCGLDALNVLTPSKRGSEEIDRSTVDMSSTKLKKVIKQEK